MRLSADIKWLDVPSKAKMRLRVVDLARSKKIDLTKVFEGPTPPDFDRVEVIVKCGKVAGRSSFAFLRKSRNKSQIVGTCSTEHITDLIEDFDFLREKLNRSKLSFTVSDPRVYFDDKKLNKEIRKRFFQIKSVLADFLGLCGFISGATGYFIFGTVNQIAIFSLVLGLTCLVGSVVLGCWANPKYVLVELE